MSLLEFSFSKQLTVYSSFGTDWNILTVTPTAIKIVIHITVVPRGCGLLTIPRSMLSFHQLVHVFWLCLKSGNNYWMIKTQFLQCNATFDQKGTKLMPTHDDISLSYNLCLPNRRMLIRQTEMVNMVDIIKEVASWHADYIVYPPYG